MVMVVMMMVVEGAVELWSWVRVGGSQMITGRGVSKVDGVEFVGISL